MTTKLKKIAGLVSSGDIRQAATIVMAEKWAILPRNLEQICTIASGMGDIDAVTKKRGEQLSEGSSITMRGSTAIVGLKGPLFRYANLFTAFSGATSYQMFAKSFTEALEDDRVENIIIDIDSPGGMVNGMTETSQLIYEARSVKPIYAYIGGTGASAAYGLASAAEWIVAEKSSVVGSIGVVATFYDEDEETIEIVSSNAPNKRPDIKTEDGRALVLKELDSLEKVFIEQVADYRGVSFETVLSDFGQGGVLVGEEAFDAGMVNEISTLESLIAGLSGDKSEVVYMPKPSQAKGDADKPEITAKLIAGEHPEVAEELRAEGRESVDMDAAREEGATNERERIKSVFDASMPGHEELISSLAFDGKTTGGQAALKVLAAEREKGSKHRASVEKDIENPPQPSAVNTDKKTEQKSDEDDWENNADLRAEYGDDKAAYDAYRDANNQGRVKVLGGK